jgi:hypothetical protein
MALLRFAANPMDAEQGEGGLQILAVTANIGEEPFLAPARPRACHCQLWQLSRSTSG